MIAIDDIRIDDEFEKLLNPLSNEERCGLIESVRRDGFTDPLIVWLGRGLLVDGHNRLDIWRKQLLEDEDRAPQIVEKSFASRDDVKEFILRRQLARRNLTDAMRVKVTLQLKPFIEAKSKSKEHDRKTTPTTLSKSLPRIDTRKELAAMAGVSEGTFQKAQVVLNSDREEVKASMLSGGTSINAAHKEVEKTKAKPIKASIGPQAPKARESAPEDNDSDVLFELKRLWRRANKKDRSSFQKWIGEGK